MLAYTITLPESYHELNTPARGYLEGVIVRFESGAEYELAFLDDYNRTHYGFYFEKQNIVIVEDVTAENVSAEISKLVASGAFDSLQPIVTPRPAP